MTDEAYLNFDDVDLDPTKEPRRGRRARSGRPSGVDPVAAIVGTDAVVPPAEAAAPSRRRRFAEPPPPVDPADDPAAPRPRRRTQPPALDQRPPSSGGRDVPVAAAVGAALALVAIVAFAIGPAAAMVLVEIIIVLAGAEYFGAVQRGGFRPATLLGLTAVAALPVATYWKGEAAPPMILFLALVVGVLWYLLGVGSRARPTANLGVTLLGIVWVGVLGSFAALLLKIPVARA